MREGEEGIQEGNEKKKEDRKRKWKRVGGKGHRWEKEVK